MPDDIERRSAGKLKVFGWIGWRTGVVVHPHAPWNHQTYEIVAAQSQAEVGRIVGEDPRRLHNLSETSNAEAVVQALAEPGVVFWRGLNDRAGVWRRA
jgi:hypothetical protein